MKKLTGTPKRCVFRVLLILLIVAMTVSGCTFFGAQGEDPTEPQNDDISPVSALTQYLTTPVVDAGHRINQFQYDLNLLKMSGQPDNEFQAQAYIAKLDPESFYYMCAYCSCTHENETKYYTCIEDYIWVKFESANAIPEYYSDKKFVVAFQLNETRDCRNVMPTECAIPQITYYQKYAPEFVDGQNVAKPLLSVKTFVVKNLIFEMNHIFFNEKISFYPTAEACVVLDGVCYLARKLGVEFSDGIYDLGGGKYNSVLNQIMVTDKYYETDINGNTVHFGLFNLDDIVDILLNWEDE